MKEGLPDGQEEKELFKQEPTAYTRAGRYQSIPPPYSISMFYMPTMHHTLWMKQIWKKGEQLLMAGACWRRKMKDDYSYWQRQTVTLIMLFQVLLFFSK